MPPALMIARSAIIHSGRFSETSATRSPRLRPTARQALDLRRGVAPADRPIGAVALRPEEGFVAIAPRLIEEHGGKIGPASLGDVSVGHAFALLEVTAEYRRLLLASI